MEDPGLMSTLNGSFGKLGKKHFRQMSRIEEDLLLQKISLFNSSHHQSLYLFSHSHTSFKSPNSLEYPPLSLVSVYLHKYLWLFCDWPSLLHHIPTCSGPAVLLQFHETGHFMIERKVTQNVFLAPHPTHSRPSNLDKGLQPRARNFNENVLMSFVSIDSFKVYPVLISRLLRSINQQITFYN